MFQINELILKGLDIVRKAFQIKNGEMKELYNPV